MSAWLPFKHGETPLAFGQRYLFADPQTRLCGVRWAHDPPPQATWCAKLLDLMATIPSHPAGLISDEGGEA